MKKQRKSMKLLSVVMLMCLVSCASTQTHLAQNPNSDETELVRKCDSALSKCDRALKDKDKVIKQQKDMLDESEKHISELEQDDSGILSSNTFYFILGVVFTILIRIPLH